MLANDLLRAIGCSAVVEDTWRISLPTFLNPSVCFREHPTCYGQFRAYFAGQAVTFHYTCSLLQSQYRALALPLLKAYFQISFRGSCPKYMPNRARQLGSSEDIATTTCLAAGCCFSSAARQLVPAPKAVSSLMALTCLYLQVYRSPR
jgi:hypothetical protein